MEGRTLRAASPLLGPGPRVKLLAVMPGPKELLERGRARWSEALWLRGAEARARALTPAQQRFARLAALGARQRVAAAGDLRDARSVAAAAAIYREALCLALAAWVTARAGAPPEPLEPAELLRSFQQLRTDAPPACAAVVAALEWLAPPADLLEFDRLGQPQALARLVTLELAVTALLAEVEVRSVAQLRRARALRLGALLLSGVAALAGLAWTLTRPPNVALGKEASASAYWRGSPPASALCNGAIETPWGSATASDKDGSWFAVDLGRSHALDRVVLVNRADRYAGDTAGLELELSMDGQAWEKVERFTEPTTSGQRLTWRARGRVARWLRARHPKRGFALSEVEVYGRPE